MSACARPGCAGAIEDGYCDVCGLADPAVRAPAPLVPGVVPEQSRVCSGCEAPLKREGGFCPRCGQAYSFVPALKAGALVNNRYEIKGTLAFGGLGWIYLARDTVLARWVTLKGILDTKDPRMLAVAAAEREFLAKVKHPNIVGIYDFITHGDHGFIVMEHVDGKTLMDLRRERGGPLPPAEAIGHIAAILPAFAHLDSLGLVHCDMKPENVMVEEGTVKLIDLGAVRRVDDPRGDIYGSRGYAAPEAAERPSPRSDLYSVGRALAVLVADFDFQGEHQHSLPSPGEVPAFARHEGLYRFLLKATRARPEDRFQSAGEMADKLLDVRLRVVAETVRWLVSPERGAPSLDAAEAAAESLSSFEGRMDAIEAQALRGEIWSAAARALTGGAGGSGRSPILGVAIAEGDLRRAAEEAYRTAARQAKTDEQRWALVDLANRVRPLTWT